ncbi:hypothetical protein [Streptomyces clavuligerus]|uniref:hypothetical protein n=1 Tax=Streptomyces clavuligerus TaxID=1901 RepID=UPI0018D0AD07|nr:hypothetical protein [Streptomyces clavuligerus]
MSGNAPVDPAEIPVFTGDLAALDGQVKALAGHGTKVVDAADDVHTSFGGLSAFYRAPEAEQLFATTQPVTATAGRISSDTCVLAGALGTYANEVRPLIARFEVLRAEAVSFREQIKDDDKWREDGDLIDENLGRRNEVAEVWARFQEAERTAHATIVALVGGKPLRLNDGSNAADMYGYDAEAMKASKSLPWGDAVAESTPWWQVWEHAADFVTGFVIDGVWATAKGLSVLVGFEGLDAAGQAWKGLAQLATGVVVTVVAGPSFWTAKDEDLPSWLRDSRTAMKETGKALVAWDQWDTNPSRAAGAVTFNVVTTIFTGGAADNVPSNTVDNTGTGSRGGTSDGAPGGGGAVNSTPDTTPAGGGGSTADDVTSGGGRGGDGSPGGSGGDDGPPNPLERPSYMRDGKNPYGPPGSLTLEQIERIQVYRANTEPGYFEEFYKKNGDRRLLSRTDASELAPPQLTRSGPNEPWVRAKDAPDPPPPSYLEPDYISRGRDTVTDQKRLEGLDEAARKRYMAIEFDNIVKYYKDAAGEVHGVVKSEESAALLKDGEILYKESHTAMGKEAGQFGEYVAEHHYIPENHPGAVKETLHGPKNGNHQFDQVWRLPDGKYVVVEAKSSVDTRLGARNLPDGRRVSQGTREYFEDIIRVMRRRGKDIDSERLLADALEDALARGNLEYAVVKGEPKSPQYTGYRYQRFDISKRSLP